MDLLQHSVPHSGGQEGNRDFDGLDRLAWPPEAKEDVTDLERARRAKLWVFEAAERLMSDQKLYRQPTVTLTMLAKKLNVSTRCLSASIGHYAGQSFRDYVNTYRVSYVRKALRRPAPDRPPIAQVAIEAGFISPSTFYAAFKRQWGMTPRQCIKEARSLERAQQCRADTASG